MIVSASRRTDIPAFHADWLLERLRQGHADVANPFRPTQVRRVDLHNPDALVLWTRNPAPLLPHLPAWERRGLRTVWLVTLTGYPRWLETATPSVDEALSALKQLSAVVGPARIAWRYDPVVACPAKGLDEAWHRENFARLAERLTGLVHHAVVSLYDDYAKARKRLASAGANHEEASALAAVRAIAEIAQELGLPLQSCCEESTSVGIDPGGCIDGRWLDQLWGLNLAGKTDKSQRKGCLCAPSADIGAYDTCAHGCLYCYATRNANS